MCGRETCSGFSCEYSYSSLIFVEYSCLATTMLLAFVFHVSLVRDVSSLVLESTLLFHCLTSWRVLCSNKFIGVWLETENASCGRWYMERHTHACRSLSWII